MRLLVLGGLLVTGLMADIRPGAAEVLYPWCARYDWTTRNCGFVSFEQCLATVRGRGGFCERNALYDAPLAPGSRKAPRIN
jgi:hypothetical protein